ncbi:hypothetical protein EMIHUDRAFT_213125 [Emiliania huxleyi CCMP1516]|uniref:Uncharacterized protein n=2 Tax=Emiliania huxleyi TaxID=2903 RepID=A0A0D3INQ4_EMIH1|nr:hypothetical protein EMIHUDRAFT_213125 [Emiliania huxleyi CCMP1516]EOD12889.1 hypothetical protein EMIHUDRAFT_213125 [Emiliania huxleyi CCMP1516]|eukprot:XP_005765318.1 hypothetical protein EMIHUDRAFT_213125 [Emiliania huxleyi CCMP1516]
MPARAGDYGIVIDAGSSGTRLRIFRWWQQAGRRLYLREVSAGEQAEALRVRPGLSAFATTPEVAAAQVSGLVRVAASIVPAAAQAATPVYLYATAGLRLLPASQAQALLDTVGRFLTGQAAAPAEEWRCPFAFGEARASSEARLISGEEEAVYGWISVAHVLPEGVSAGEMKDSERASAAVLAPPSPLGRVGVGIDGAAEKEHAEAERLVDDCYAVERCGRLSRPFLGRFYGAGNYYYTALQLGLARPAGIFLWRHARLGCFSGLYVSELLRRLVSIPPDAPIAVARSIDGTTLDWSLGALLHASSGAGGAPTGGETAHAAHAVYATREASGTSLRATQLDASAASVPAPSAATAVVCRQLLADPLGRAPLCHDAIPPWAALAAVAVAWVGGCVGSWLCCRRLAGPPAEKPAAARSRRGGRSGYAPVEAREASPDPLAVESAV